MSVESNQIELDDDPVELPADTLAILSEFLQNKQEQESSENAKLNSKGIFEEDWQLSQFWYNENTKHTLAKVCLRLILNRSGQQSASDVKIALLSCSSLYKSIRRIHLNGEVRLFEYDEQFSAFKDDFVHYDYSEASNEQYLDEYRNRFDIIIADPPFLSEECIRNTSSIINKLKKDDSDIVKCSGEIVAEWIKEFLQLKQCEYRPEHERNLANEFRSYANLELDSFV